MSLLGLKSLNSLNS